MEKNKIKENPFCRNSANGCLHCTEGQKWSCPDANNRYQQFQFWYERLRYIVKMIPAMLSQLIYDTETIYEAK